MASSALPSIPADIAMITGPTMLGICLNWGFMGVLTVQLYYYFSNFGSDSKGIKMLVYGLAFLDVLQTVLVTADAFHWFVFGFGNMNQLDDTFLNSWDVPLLDALISLIVQVFYCWRIYVLRKSWVFPGLIIFVSVVQCTFGTVTAVKAHELGKLSLIGSTKAKVAFQTIWLVGSMVADVAIAAVLSWTLLRARTKAFRTSHSVINRIVTMTVETNALTAGIALVAVVVYLAVPQHTTLVVPPTAVIGKLYTNCLIAVLNNRPFQAASSTTGSNRTALNSTAASANVPNFRANPNKVRVQMHTESTMEMSHFEHEKSTSCGPRV
ncbi:hypothetical protein B0H19DRAFT_168732 [Mycena capillaripes]|nr:hypothetical protein B0H19DRAFT_168732 [Mycena capillaripes]